MSVLSSTTIAASIFTGTLFSEDAAFVSSLVLSKQGIIPLWMGCVASAAGIGVGDFGIFFMGRIASKHPWLARKTARVLSRVPEHLLRKGVFGARFVPGLRLGTYLFAGVSKMPFSKFITLNFFSLIIWIGAGAALSVLGVKTNFPAWLWCAFIALGLVLSTLANTVRLRVSIYRLKSLRHFEFWPATLFYVPVALYYLWLSFKYRSFHYPLLANPLIPNAGIIGEEKSLILSWLPKNDPSFLKFIRIDSSLQSQDRLDLGRGFMSSENINFPIILKPDVGQRGSGVSLVRNEAQFRSELEMLTYPAILQEYCPFQEEVGVNYVRFPNESSGKLIGITHKRFPSVTGDGKTSLMELILHDPRAKLIAKTYFKRHAQRLKDIIPAGENFKLVESGNHCQGAIFENGIDLLSPRLSEEIERIISAIPQFYVGRFDLRFESEEALKQGLFKIIELNGAAGEATHIYDPKNSLGYAYRTLFAQLRDLFAIGKLNSELGISPKTSFFRSLIKYKQQSQNHQATS